MKTRSQNPVKKTSTHAKLKHPNKSTKKKHSKQSAASSHTTSNNQNYSTSTHSHHQGQPYNFRNKKSSHHSPSMFSRPTPSQQIKVVPSVALPTTLPVPTSKRTVIEELTCLTTQISNINNSTLNARLQALQDKAYKDKNDPHSQFAAHITNILLSYLNNDKKYISPYNNHHDFIFDMLNSVRNLLLIIYTLKSHLIIIDNLLNSMLQNHTVVRDYTNRADLALYIAFDLLIEIKKIKLDDTEHNNTIKTQLEELVIRIIGRVLIAKCRELPAMMDMLFSFSTGNAIKKSIINSLSMSLNNDEEYTKNLLFNSGDIIHAFKTWSEINERNDLILDTEKHSSGTYGEIYKAKERDQPSNEVAIKFIKDTSTIYTSKHGFCFLRQTNHPNIVSFKYMIEIGEKTGFVMEYADYGNLSDYMFETYQPGLRLPILATHIIQGLAYIHQTGFIHGDLKPGNILVFSNGSQRMAKITDIDTFEPIGSIRKENSCTWQYSSPEDHAEGTTYQASSDIYSFGSVLYYMRALKNPYQGESKESITSRITQGITENIDHYSKPEGVASLIKWCWKLNPDERPKHDQITSCLSELTQPTLKK